MRHKEVVSRMAKGLIVLILLFALINSSQYVRGNDEMTGEYESIGAKLDETKPTRVVIHTYAGEHYEAYGTIDMIQKTDHSSETVIELEGSVTWKGNVRSDDKLEQQLQESVPAILTVYMEDEIYGFYSNHEMIVREDRGENLIEFYGYLEGFYTDEQYYSS